MHSMLAVLAELAVAAVLPRAGHRHASWLVTSRCSSYRTNDVVRLPGAQLGCRQKPLLTLLPAAQSEAVAVDLYISPTGHWSSVISSPTHGEYAGRHLSLSNLEHGPALANVPFHCTERHGVAFP